MRTAAILNAGTGNLNAIDGYDCPKCLNRGDFTEVERLEDGMPHMYLRRCECQIARASIRRMKASGLSELIGRYTMAAYRTDEPWQQTIKDKAQAFAREESPMWWYIGGAVGSGKTHICTAICRMFLGQNRTVFYSLWTDEITRLKAIRYDDADEYARTMERLKCCEVLYLDDLFKRTPGKYGDGGTPSDADVTILYDILNYRYINRKRTLISSERYLDEITDIDEGIGSRIVEMARGYVVTVGRGTGKNQRMTEGVKV